MKKTVKTIFAAALLMVVLVAMAMPFMASGTDIGGDASVVVATNTDQQAEAVANDTTATDIAQPDAETVSSTDADKTVDRQANIDAALQVMGQGMLGIFVVMILIYIVIVILNAVTAPKKSKNEK